MRILCERETTNISGGEVTVTYIKGGNITVEILNEGAFKLQSINTDISMCDWLDSWVGGTNREIEKSIVSDQFGHVIGGTYIIHPAP